MAAHRPNLSKSWTIRRKNLRLVKVKPPSVVPVNGKIGKENPLRRAKERLTSNSKRVVLRRQTKMRNLKWRTLMNPRIS